MSATKPSIPKGTRDFSPAEMSRRNYMFEVIKGVFKNHGFLPLETPAMENLSTLLGKYGEEGDKLLFRILNSGDFTRGVTPGDLENPAGMASKISEKGLRYDLTVPFARYVVQHRGQIVFPFRRYQIQPVWRADRPQKGRYREFYQCDVDIVGSRSLLCEAELVQIVDKVFTGLGISVTLKLNNRKILYGIAESIGHGDRMIDITVAIDKIDKIGMEAVAGELLSKGIPPRAVDALRPILEMGGGNREKLELLRGAVSSSPTGISGIEEMEKLLDYCQALSLEGNLEVDLSLARGLNYYTGTIFEVKANDFAIGSICGGGRYDDLTGIFGMPDTPGVGISFGADRIYDVMNGLDLFPDEAIQATRALFLNFGPAEEIAAMKALTAVRSAGIPSEIYPDSVKVKKQMEYANKRNIPLVVIIGSEELAAGTAVVKDMREGTQKTVSLEELPQALLG
ncbi:MAG: histidine--tRNA ligase [Alistipes sp.]|nr:histidine--tRNA ligase [Alistipes sp.]